MFVEMSFQKRHGKGTREGCQTLPQRGALPRGGRGLWIGVSQNVQVILKLASLISQRQ